MPFPDLRLDVLGVHRSFLIFPETRNMMDVIEENVGRQDGLTPFAARLQFAAPDLSQAEIARRAGVPKSNLNKYIGGVQPPITALVALARALDVDPVWLGTGEGAWKTVGSDLVRVTRYDVQLAAGAGTWLDRAGQLDGLVFSRDFLARLGAPDGSGLFLLGVVGDSMEPTIRDGAVVLVDGRELRFADGLWAFALGDQLRIKRLRRGLHALEVISDNPAYPPEQIAAADTDSLTLIGRVRWVGQTL
jgi:SOS-response transcriptional repressor LexA